MKRNPIIELAVSKQRLREYAVCLYFCGDCLLALPGRYSVRKTADQALARWKRRIKRQKWERKMMVLKWLTMLEARLV